VCVNADMEFINENIDDIKSRHKKEMRELDGKTRAMLKKAKKADKAKVTAEVEELRTEMANRHIAELDKASSFVEGESENADNGQKGGNGDRAQEEEESNEIANGNAAVEAEPEMSAADRKKAKAQRKREKVKQKVADAERAKEEIRRNAGPSMREEELKMLNDILARENLCVKEVPADGNCMFRAVEHQLLFTQAAVSVEDSSSSSSSSDKNQKHNYESLRKLAGEYMRTHADEFSAFLGYDADSEDYLTYCNRMACSSDWGGQLELRALSYALERQLWVYDSAAPIMRMGEEFGEAPLKLTYHRHYLALGEHYNTTTTKSVDG